MLALLWVILFIIPIGLCVRWCMQNAAPDIFAQFLACKPYDVDGWQEYGRIVFRLEKYKQCIYAMENARMCGANHEKHKDVWLLLYRSYVYEGIFDKADIILDDAMNGGIDVTDNE